MPRDDHPARLSKIHFHIPNGANARESMVFSRIVSLLNFLSDAVL